MMGQHNRAEMPSDAMATWIRGKMDLIGFLYRPLLEQARCVCIWGYTSRSDSKAIHESLAAECHFCPSEGHKITMLALECVSGVELIGALYTKIDYLHSVILGTTS
ncbi:hypothetical protein PHJA_000104600 [Phtheirospermum japonicum]|uniref:Uncharacterized protein n=1 Tax=Phtheirospermum japonicum TaxID=374723 RepID=A0A830BC37_9LAMI|nr:hypothetical protein PHJA_000104600 [Phtheirospermum japonicum]